MPQQRPQDLLILLHDHSDKYGLHRTVTPSPSRASKAIMNTVQPKNTNRCAHKFIWTPSCHLQSTSTEALKVAADISNQMKGLHLQGYISPFFSALTSSQDLSFKTIRCSLDSNRKVLNKIGSCILLPGPQ